MAVRYRPDREKWEVYWRDPGTGKRKSRSFKSEREAKKEDRRILYRLEFDRANLAKESARKKDRLTLKFLLEKVSAPRHIFNVLDACLPGIEAEDFDSKAQRVFMSRLSDSGICGNTVRRYMAFVKAGIRWAVEHGLLDEAPKYVSVKGSVAATPEPPTPEEFAKLYEAASPNMKRVLVLGAKFGLRVGPCELTSLRWEDIDFDAWVIRLRSAKKNKAEPVRAIPIPSSYRNMFVEWRDADGGSGFVIHSRSGVPRRVHQDTFNNLCKRAGVRRHIRPYDLRHAFATDMVDAGVDIVTVAKLMGHSDTTMLMKHYRHVSEARKLNAMEILCVQPVCPEDKK